MEGPDRGEAALGSVEQGSRDWATDSAKDNSGDYSTDFPKYNSGSSATDSAGNMGRREDTGVGGKGERGTGKSTSSNKSSKFIKSLMVYSFTNE
ncbi:hypothetical protein NPIL_415521 [Nephila pilipes]|uniref:Uncharacterized protein n=1 Tax=Nephila pilipes TaxID=299642 RepID=A0A8X6IAP6_NEPPI|nr:hypothetical protein NPIL_415521 [Nephila pilipes]